MHKHIEIHPHGFMSADLEKIPKMVYELRDNLNGHILRYMSETPEGMFEFLSTFLERFYDLDSEGCTGKPLTRPTLKKIIIDMGNSLKLVEPGVVNVPYFGFYASKIKPVHIEKFKNTLCYKHYYPNLILVLKPLEVVY